MNTCQDTRIPTDVNITYENGAKVGTSFVTNVPDADILIMTAPELRTALRRTIARTQGNKNNVLGVKNEYPPPIVPIPEVKRGALRGLPN